MKKRFLTLLFFVLTLVAGLALVGCKDGCKGCKDKLEEKEIATPSNLLFDGSYVTWSKVEGANYYMVSIDGGEAVRSNSTTYAYASTGTFEVTVTAIFEDEKESSASVTFKPLAKIEDISVSNDGTVSWNAVSGANAYMVSVNGLEKAITDTAYAEIPVGSNRVKVKPIVQEDTSYYSFWSEAENVYIYGAPMSVKYDGTTLTWSGNSTSYDVKINGVSNVVNGNSFDYNAERKDFVVQVVALGNYTTTYDSKPTEEEYHYLDMISALTVENGILKWDAVNGAEGYQIKIDGVVQRNDVKDAEYIDLTVGRSLDVSVMPYNNSGNYFSSWSQEKTVYILDTPVVAWNNDLELDGEANNNCTWNAVNAAAGYTVRFKKNGSVVDEYVYSDIQRAFADAYADVAVYTIEVKANADGSSADYFDSRYSDPITVERLAAPKKPTNNFVVSNKDSLAGGFTVNYIQVNGAKEYQLYKQGELLSGKKATGATLSDNNVVGEDNLEEQHYTYYIRSMGEVKTVSGKKYVTLPCLTSDALSFDITVQATPTSLLMSGYSLSWSPISGSNGYVVSYAGGTVTAQTESYNLSTVKAGTYSLAVCARGDGATTLASAYSAPLAMQRLSAPTNIKITSEANGTLAWDTVTNASGYQAFLDMSSTALDESSWDNMYQFITTAGSTVSMIATANEYNDLGTVYYMTSEISPTQQFIRLAAPVFPEGTVENSVELVWNAPSNINTQEYTPTYQVFSAIGEQIGGGNHNGTRFNIEYLEGDRQHTFYVKAIGNDTKYLNSEYSLVKAVWKLATPTMRIENGKYVWNSVTNASSYYLEIDGKKVNEDFHVSGGEYSYTPRYTEHTDHTVILKAMGDGITSLNSAGYSYTQKTKILSRPEIEYGYSADSFVNDGKIQVRIKSAVADCSLYQYEIAGETKTSSALTFEKAITNTGTYTIKVKALGGSFDATGVYCIDSEYAGGNEGEEIHLLGAPSTSSFKINSDGVISWAAISGSFGYDYQISYDGGEYNSVEHVAYNNLNPISSYKQYQTIKIKVRASGNSGGTTVNSTWVEWTWTNAS